AFRFLRCELGTGDGVARLVYAVDDGPELVETVTIPGAPFALEPVRAGQAEAALRRRHLVGGVSYCKGAEPPEIRIEGRDIDQATADLLETVYRNGLGEFAYRNGISLDGKLDFPVGATLASRSGASGEDDRDASVAPTGRGALVAIGGGKDSLVS